MHSCASMKSTHQGDLPKMNKDEKDKVFDVILKKLTTSKLGDLINITKWAQELTRDIDYALVDASVPLDVAKPLHEEMGNGPPPITRPMEICGRCGIAIRPEGGHRCESCGRDI